MMRSRFRMYLSLLLALCLFCAPAAAIEKTPSAPQQRTLILQLGSTSALLGEEIISVPASRYADNGAIQVPLRAVCDAFGMTLAWDAVHKEAIVNRGALVFTQGSWTCTVKGEPMTLTTPVQNVGGTLYIPLQALTALENLYVHSFGFYEGGYLVITDHPLTAGDTNGHPNEPFNAKNPDKALSACAALALEKLGPNTGYFDKTAILMRCDSRHVYVGETADTLCEAGGTVMPQLAGSRLLLPVEQTARLCGWQSAPGESGSIVLSLADRKVTLDPVKLTMTANDAERSAALRAIDGTLYCYASDFRTAFGVYVTFNSTDRFAMITPYDVSKRVDLQERAWAKCFSLVLQRYDSAKGLIALTFDDGPSGKLTERLLDGLKSRGAHATFFLCDYRIRSFPEVLSRYLSEGHELGNHSANHATLTAVSASVLASELDKPNQSIKSLAGVNPVLMRPPGGAYNKTVLEAAGKRGMSCIMWSLDTLDWKNRNADTIVKKVLGSVRDGDIILMHDLYTTSVDAALRIVDALQAKGYVFVTVSELAEAKGIDLKAGSVYNKLQ